MTPLVEVVALGVLALPMRIEGLPRVDVMLLVSFRTGFGGGCEGVAGEEEDEADSDGEDVDVKGDN